MSMEAGRVIAAGRLGKSHIFCGAGFYALRADNILLDYGDSPPRELDIMMTLEEAKIMHAAFPEMPVVGWGADAVTERG